MRLCVETAIKFCFDSSFSKAAAFVRLCVETISAWGRLSAAAAAAFVRLCVETGIIVICDKDNIAAAFVRLCVETL